MATTIKGTVFNDINHNGVRDPGEPGISNVFVTLRRVSNGTCVQTSTNTSGVYSFTVHAAGTYQIAAGVISIHTTVTQTAFII